MLEKMGEFFDARLAGYEAHQLTSIASAEEFYPFTAACLPRTPGARVLDLCCGTGCIGVSLAKLGGAGTLVPITGFSNAMASPALEFKAEGFVAGMAAKMFVIAGPVLVYGIGSSVLYGILLVLFQA